MNDWNPASCHQAQVRVPAEAGLSFVQASGFAFPTQRDATVPQAVRPGSVVPAVLTDSGHGQQVLQHMGSAEKDL